MQASPMRRSSPLRCESQSPLPQLPHALAKCVPFQLTCNPRLPMPQQMRAGQSMRWYGSVLCITHWNEDCRRNGPEAYVQCHLPSRGCKKNCADCTDATPHLLCTLEWEDGHCDGLHEFDLDGIGLQHWNADKTFSQQRQSGKTVEWLDDNVLRVCHWNRDGQRHGPDQYWAMFPHRPPLLLRKQAWCCGRRDGDEVHYCDSEPMCERPMPLEILRRHWIDGQLDGCEVATNAQTHIRAERFWDRGLLNGPETRRYANGRNQLECFWVNGQLHGRWTLYYKSGQLCQSGMLQNGRRQGTWNFCARNGRLLRSLNYVLGRQTGLQQELSESNRWNNREMNKLEANRQRQQAMLRQLDNLRYCLACADALQRAKLERKLNRLQAHLQ